MEPPENEDDEINYTDIPEWTAAQWSRAVRGKDARKILRARSEATRPAREAFWAAVRPITKTDVFKRWFAGSKAVTEEENLRVLFHATASSSNDFYCSQGLVGSEYGADFGRGYYFFSSPETALTYRSPPSNDTGDRSIKPVPVYLCAVNPLILRSGKDLGALWAGAGARLLGLRGRLRRRQRTFWASVLTQCWLAGTRNGSCTGPPKSQQLSLTAEKLANHQIQ